jgi:Tol biopolymer transport system component
MDPAIDPDGRFLIFAGNESDSLGSADLYLAIFQPDGSTATPIRLPAGVNSPWLENAPSLGPDFGELYVTSARPIDWKQPSDDLRQAPLPLTVEALQVELLDQPLNGSRNLWRFDIADWLRAQGVEPRPAE